MAPDYISLLDMGSERAVADLAVAALEENPGDLKQFLDLCFLEQYPLSMRASRVIQLYCEKHPDAIYPYLEETVEKMLVSKIDGVKRNFLKIYDEFIDINRLTEPGPLLNACFDWLINPSEKPGTRIHAMNVIFNISQKEPDLLKELYATLEIAGEEGETSIRNCISKMKKRISILISQ
jgi:hypothetical protein